MQAKSVAQLAALAMTLGDETAATLADELLEQLPRGELNLLVVGQFKRGKSTLVNALLGADVMPTGALPITSVVTSIRYGEAPSIDVRLRRDANPQRISVEELSLYVSERYNPDNRLGVERVDVAWPSERIRGFVLFDTPGIGSTYEHNTATALAALPRADAAILVVGPEPPIGAEELRYARNVVASSERLFVVLNKCDVAGDSLQEVLDFTVAALSKVLPDGAEIAIASLSATQVREMQNTSREDSGFAAFVDTLREFVALQGAQTHIRSARRRALAIAHRLDVLLSMRREALGLPRAERERRKMLVERTLQAVDDRVRSLELMVDDDVRRLRLALEEAMDGFHDRDEPLFRASASSLATERSADRRAEQLRHLVAERARVWREAAIERTDRELRDAAAKYGRLLGEIETAALEAGCEALHVDASELAPRDIAFAPAQLNLIASAEPTTGLELLVAFVVGLLPAGLRIPVLRRRYDDVLASELDALRGKLRYGIAHDLEPWRRSVRATIASSIENTQHVVLQAFDDLASSNGSEEVALERVHGLERELAALRADLQREQLPC